MEHRRIENKLHWVLDVTFGEDLSRLRTGHGAKNMAAVLHFRTLFRPSCRVVVPASPERQRLCVGTDRRRGLQGLTGSIEPPRPYGARW
jgi:hypothetical protein